MGKSRRRIQSRNKQLLQSRKGRSLRSRRSSRRRSSSRRRASSSRRSARNMRGGKKTKKMKYSFKEPLLEEKKNFTPTKEKFIPSYDIVNEPGFGSVIMNLKKGQKLITQYGSMSYMDGHIETKTTSRGGIWKGIKRALFTSQSMFMTQYIGSNATKNKICFASFLPGSILPLRVRPTERIIISPQSLICFTDNLTIATKRRIRGAFTAEGIAQTQFINETEEDGLVWLASYGAYNKVSVKEGEVLKLDNGLFLCSQTGVKYDVGYVGSIKTAILSGEGLVMNFTGPCEIYTQGRNVNGLINFIGQSLPPRN